MRHVYIFFATGRCKQGRRRYRLVSWLIRVFTLSPVCHCMIGYDGAVLDPSLSGVRYWPLLMVIRRYPGVYAVFRIPVAHGINLDFYTPYVGVPQPLSPRLLRWLRFGRGPWIYDCLCVALACLHAGGVSAPPTIATPIGLYRWLLEQDYPHVCCRDFPTDEEFRKVAETMVVD